MDDPVLDEQPRTLAHVLQACQADACVPEKYWVALVAAMSRGDQLALHALYARTSRLVFTWLLRITGDRRAAEPVLVDVFLDAWRRASTYDPAGGSVLAWLLNQARSRAIDGPRVATFPEPREKEFSYVLLWQRLARRLAEETGQELVVSPQQAPELEWEDVAPGISCTLLARDVDRGAVAMLVRLGPGVEYPPHIHAGVEELYMFEGDLSVDGKDLRAGDYLRSEPGTSDHRVWSRTGCSGVLITSAHDVLL